jgi:hypothetical protein
MKKIIEGLILTAVRPTTIQVAVFSECLSRSRYNLLYKFALTENYCISCSV